MMVELTEDPRYGTETRKVIETLDLWVDLPHFLVDLNSPRGDILIFGGTILFKRGRWKGEAMM